MNKFYNSIGTSRQAFHGKLNRYMRRQEELAQLTLIMDDFRKDHPGMSLRDAYKVIQPVQIGRDKFEQYFKDLGYGVGRKKSLRRTTDPSGVTRFPNLIKDKKLTGVNQVWVSDITYYQIGERFCYLTFIMDLYSRRIIGHSASRTLLTEQTTIPALRMALKNRKETKIQGLIIHSDGGGQYYSKEFRKLTQSSGILNSMAENVYENPHAERVNGIIKNNYLVHYNPISFIQLENKLEKAVRMYNYQKPHKGLKGMTPIYFETSNNQINIIIKNINFKSDLITQKPVNVI